MISSLTHLSFTNFFLEWGCSVRIIEARNRIGGRIWSMSVEDAFEDSLVSALPEMYQPTGVIDMGAEYFDKELHVTLKAELDRYGIQFDETVSSSMNKCWSFTDGTSLSTNDVPIPLHSAAERDEYNRVMDILEFHMQKFRIDQDYRRPRKMFGFTTDELEMLDISFNNYVNLTF